MEHQYLYFLVIIVFAVIQSVFGMGILVFGTPTLILLGYDFSDVLGLLLPSSVFISFTQMYTAKTLSFTGREKSNMVICAVAVVALLSLILTVSLKINIDVLIGIILIFSAAVRLSPKFRTAVNQGLFSNQRGFVLLMGAVHGLTNMGGALLTLYSTSTQSEKVGIRTSVSRYYLMFGLIQLATLAILRPQALSLLGLEAAPLALFIYWAVGNLLFRRASAPFYERLLTVFIAVYGIVVITKDYI
jgi:hypothetical protein